MTVTRILPILVIGVLVLAAPATASATSAYNWPIKPFRQAHPIRGQINDPRMNGPVFDSSSSHTFHFGIDISTPDGTPVYAVAPGFVHYIDASALGVRGKKGHSSFGYWHIRFAVADKTHVKLHQLLGYVEQGRGHVHFAEWRGGHYINPLRRGALAPYSDRTRPTIASLSTYDGTYHSLAGTTLSGTVNLTVNTFDTPQLMSNWPWARVTPAFISWQIYSDAGWLIRVGHWDLRKAHCAQDPLTIFSPGDYSNSKHGPGNYNYWLGHTWNTARVSDGTYWLVVTVSDIRDNSATKIISFSVANVPAPSPATPPAERVLL